MTLSQEFFLGLIISANLLLVHGLSIDTTVAPAVITASSVNSTQSTGNNENNKSALIPPLIFPNDPGQYKILELNDASSNNETAIKILLSRVRQEHDDNVEGQDVSKVLNKTVIVITTPEPAHVEPTDSDAVEVDENLKSEVEEIQDSDNMENEIGLEELFHKQQSSNLQLNPVFAEDIETNSHNLHGGHITAIFAGILAVVSIGIYVTLITWRSYLEKRYGMREQLVTEDDYYNNNDIRHFAL